RSEDLVARYGGEELVALLPHSDAQAATDWAERVRARIAALAIPWTGGPLRVTASFGVAVFPGSGADRDALVESSDQTLYMARRAGRNRVAVAAAVEASERRARAR